MKLGVWIPNCRHLATPDVMRTTAVRDQLLATGVRVRPAL